MDFTVEISSKINEKDWDEKLLQSKASTVYQTSNWSKLYEEAFDSKPVFIVVKNSSEEIVGQLLALIHDKFAWRDTNIISQTIGHRLHLDSFVNWNYGPIIHDTTHQDEIISIILSTIDKVAIHHNVTRIRGSSPPLAVGFSDELFRKFNYELKPWKTYVIDLRQNIDNLYNQLNKKTRYDIRKVENNELEFEIGKDRHALTEYTQLGIQIRKKRGEKRSLNPNNLDLNWKYLYEKEFLKVFLARHNGNLIAGIWNIMFNGNIIQLGVENSSKTEFSGGTYLTWNTIKWAIQMNYLTYDMGGANPNPVNEKEKQIDFYKSKWSGKEYSYMLYTKILNKTKLNASTVIKSPRKISKEITKLIHKKTS
jgi:lipid II:glycine glycyltransferase (peptidoglycan interpeptide bridge formation enzyme)